MSRSTRRPYAAITGTSSAKSDKRFANRGVRRAHNRNLKCCTDLENLLLPHRLECSWNEVWIWGRDGKQIYRGDGHYSSDLSSRRRYEELMRK
jgi:hypothetical protein